MDRVRMQELSYYREQERKLVYALEELINERGSSDGAESFPLVERIRALLPSVEIPEQPSVLHLPIGLDAIVGQHTLSSMGYTRMGQSVAADFHDRCARSLQAVIDALASKPASVDASPLAGLDHPLDPGIARYVEILVSKGIETYESCEGGPGHCFTEPTVRFHGGQEEGLRALSVALRHDLPVHALRRFWSVVDGEPEGPHWEMVFKRKTNGQRSYPLPGGED